MSGITIRAYLVSYCSVNSDGKRVDDYSMPNAIILSTEVDASSLLEKISMKGTFNNVGPYEETRDWTHSAYKSGSMYAECIQLIHRKDADPKLEDHFVKIVVDGRFRTIMV
ncbi:MAG: hypothetical protein HY226_05250 [Candidatus Vogelbacteria bacterium]|nr:hypothetical protein [Candidatus Vogelbacteria bacterium]